MSTRPSTCPRAPTTCTSLVELRAHFVERPASHSRPRDRFVLVGTMSLLLKTYGLLLLLVESTSFAHAFASPRTAVSLRADRKAVHVMAAGSNADDHMGEISELHVADVPSDESRRQMFADVLRTTAALTAGMGCGCIGCSPHAAYGLAQITPPPPEAIATYDLARNGLQDAAFATGMAYGMRDYEKEAYPKKKQLFRKLFESLDGVQEPAIVEVGMGSFPNALYYNKMDGLDIIGVDPNDQMAGYARDSATRAGLVPKDSLRIVHGVSEALPLADASADAVVCTLTLCSVLDPVRSVAEMKRILKPSGKLLFWEHVLSETDPALARQQVELTPSQVIRADGCHLDRRTGDVMRAAGFKNLDMEYLELENFSFLNPTVCGIAYKFSSI